MKRLATIQHSEDGRVTIEFHTGIKAGETEEIEPGYAHEIYTYGCGTAIVLATICVILIAIFVL